MNTPLAALCSLWSCSELSQPAALTAAVYRRSVVNLDGDVAMVNVECTDGEVLPDSRRMAFRWKQVDGPPLFNTSFLSYKAFGLYQESSFTRYLSIPSQTLAANTDYKFELTATLTDNVALTGKSIAVVRVSEKPFWGRLTRVLRPISPAT